MESAARPQVERGPDQAANTSGACPPAAVRVIGIRRPRPRQPSVSACINLPLTDQPLLIDHLWLGQLTALDLQRLLSVVAKPEARAPKPRRHRGDGYA